MTRQRRRNWFLVAKFQVPYSRLSSFPIHAGGHSGVTREWDSREYGFNPNWQSAASVDCVSILGPWMAGLQIIMGAGFHAVCTGIQCISERSFHVISSCEHRTRNICTALSFSCFSRESWTRAQSISNKYLMLRSVNGKRNTTLPSRLLSQ